MVELNEQDREQLEYILRCVRHFEETLGCHYRDGLWARMDKLYHSYTGLKRALRDTTGKARDDTYRDARTEFGHDLAIPYAFSIVETVLPAMLSNRPRLLVLPGDQASEKNVEHMKAMIDSQQANINLELPLQSVVKSGLMYGIGFGKSYWLRREGRRQRLEPLHPLHPARLKGQKWGIVESPEPLFDDPTFEHIPVRDFGWDVFASSMDGARYAWHRTWRDTAYVMDRLADPGGWTHTPGLTKDDLDTGNGSVEKFQESIRGSFNAQEIPLPSNHSRQVDLHEVLEFHNRAMVITILDRKWIVCIVENEAWYGRLPFPCFRPTEVLNQMVGKGEIEPGEDLFLEMDQLRTDRRWAASMALQPVIFYDDGVVNPDQIKVGPGEMNPVNGDPREHIWQLQIADVPASSYRETAEIASDIVRMSGISDAFAGGENSQETATGAQLQLAQASRRIQFKTHRAEIELIKPIARHWIALDQRHILETRDVRAPMPPQPDEPERRWAWFKLGPAEMLGEFDVEPDGGSTSPDNIPQKRQDAQFKLALLNSPVGQQLLDVREVALSMLEDAGFKNPESYLSQGQQVPPETLALIAQELAQVGMDPGEAQQLVAMALHQTLEAKDQQVQAPDHGTPPPGGQPQLPMAA